MEITHVYQKKRREFGRQCVFSEYSPRPDPNNTIEPDAELAKQYIPKNPCDAAVQCAPELSEHETNTERVTTENRGMNHVEGGWPKDVNIQEVEQTIRYRKKVEKDEVYINMIQRLGITMEHAIKQNNAVDIFEEYFEGIQDELPVEALSAKTVNEYRDPNTNPRSVSCLCWSPDGGNKLAGAYSILDFQKADSDTKLESCIWDVENPSKPEMLLKPSSAIVTLEYSPKEAHTIAAGCYNGQVAFFDTRRGSQPIDTSAVEHSHKDAVRRVIYLTSKSGSEFFSTSTDGMVLWWDARKMSEPIERLELPAGKTSSKKVGGTALEFESTMPTKFMVGTEKGSIISCNKKGKTAADKIAGMFYGHIGAIQAIQRNPFVPKSFLSIGDWTCRLWSEEIKEQSVWWTPQDPAFLADGCWSPVRPAVFYTAKQSGHIDVWDLTLDQGKASMSVPICPEPLTSLRAQEQGRLLAAGSKAGNITLIEVTKTLINPVRDEKQIFTTIMDRETRREKILEGRAREMKLKEKAAKTQVMESEPAEGEEEEDPLTKANKEYASIIEFERKELQRRKDKRNKQLSEANAEAEKEVEKRLSVHTQKLRAEMQHALHSGSGQALVRPGSSLRPPSSQGRAAATAATTSQATTSTAAAATASTSPAAAAATATTPASASADNQTKPPSAAAAATSQAAASSSPEVKAATAAAAASASPSGSVQGGNSPKQVAKDNPASPPPAVDA